MCASNCFQATCCASRGPSWHPLCGDPIARPNKAEENRETAATQRPPGGSPCRVQTASARSRASAMTWGFQEALASHQRSLARELHGSSHLTVGLPIFQPPQTQMGAGDDLQSGCVVRRYSSQVAPNLRSGSTNLWTAAPSAARALGNARGNQRRAGRTPAGKFNLCMPLASGRISHLPTLRPTIGRASALDADGLLEPPTSSLQYSQLLRRRSRFVNCGLHRAHKRCRRYVYAHPKHRQLPNLTNTEFEVVERHNSVFRLQPKLRCLPLRSGS